MDQHPAVHVERDTGGVRRKVAAEEQCGAGNILRIAEAVKRNARQDGGFHLITQLACGDVRLNKTRRDAVNAHVIRPQLAGHRFRQAQHTRFRGTVVWPAKNTATALG